MYTEEINLRIKAIFDLLNSHYLTDIDSQIEFINKMKVVLSLGRMPVLEAVNNSLKELKTIKRKSIPTKSQKVLGDQFMGKYEDKALTLLQTLCNASGAEFENEVLAVEIIADTLRKEI